MAVVREVANKSRIFTKRAAHHQANPQQVGEPVEYDLEELETEGLVGTPEIIGPSLETFVQLPLPSTQPSIIPHPSPHQGQAPPPPSFSPPPTPPLSPPPPPPTKLQKQTRKLPSAHIPVRAITAHTLAPSVSCAG